MIKLVAAGLVGMTAALGGAFFGYDLILTGNGTVEDQPVGEQLQQVTAELTGVPVIVNNTVAGYVVLKVSSTVDTARLPARDIAVQPYLVDAAFKATYAFADRGFTRIRPKDLDVLSGEIVRMANEKLGSDVVKTASLEQFNFVAKGEIRGMLMNPK